eukprot:jgi/Orpsp1_1/1189582/evm.model.d7180000073038.1
MKFLGSFIILAILNLVSVLAGPPRSETIKDDQFKYHIQYDGNHIAYITDVIDKNADTLTIPNYVVHKGETYYVHALAGGLTNSYVTKLEIPFYVYHYFSIWGNVLKEAKYLKELKIDCFYDVEFFEDTFNGVNPNIQIYGQGVDKAMMSYAKKILQNNYPDLIRDYSNVSDYDKKCALYQIAKIVNKTFGYNTNIAYPHNGAVALAVKQGSTRGLARVVRIFAIAAGYNQDEILVGGDGSYLDFNYVKFNGRFYVLDAVKTKYNDRDLCSTSVIQTSSRFNEKVLKPFYGSKVSTSKWVLYNQKYGFPNDYADPEVENFVKWCSKHNTSLA